MSAGAGAVAVPRALLRASVLPAGPAAAVPHAVAAGGGTFVQGGCCWPIMIKCCPDYDNHAAPASGDSP
jgi:hypothetical protein